MSRRLAIALVVLAWLAAAPGVARAGVCYVLTGLPEAAGLDIVALASPPQGPVPIVGQAQGLCGLGQPPVSVQGTAIFDPGGAARVGIKLVSARAGCSGGEAELVLPSPFSIGSGQVRLPEGSVANVGLALDPNGVACQLRPPRPDACVASPTTLCLLQNRFRVTATAVFAAQNVAGQARKNGSESGFFSFLDPSAVELVVKVLDRRAVNAFYWVVATTTTTIEYTLTVTDTQTGRVRVYVTPLGTAPAPIHDSTAFSAAP